MAAFPYLWTATWTILGVVAVWFLAFWEIDEKIKYKVPVPKLPEKFEILEEPSIRVINYLPYHLRPPHPHHHS